MSSLLLEWGMRLPFMHNKEIATIYFGGGTPALFGPERIKALLELICRDVKVVPNAEITLEANPENISLGEIKAYQQAGINRVSIGIQSLDDSLLKTLGRQHQARKAIEAVHLVSEAGVKNISIDLMYDLPDQQQQHWENTLQQVSLLPLTHLSLYNLTIEPQTVFFKMKEHLTQRLPTDEISLQMYERAVEFLQGIGLIQYEISAFCRPPHSSKHNTGYWTGRPFLGLGPSAFSYWQGSRFRNIANLNKYDQMLKEGVFPIDFSEILDPEAQIRELLTIQLRLIDGVDLSEFENVRGRIPLETYNVIDKLMQEGLLEKIGSRLKLTRRGILCYDHVAGELI